MSAMQTTVILCDGCQQVCPPGPVVLRSPEARAAALANDYRAFRSKQGRLVDYCGLCRDTPALLAAGYVRVTP